MADGHVAGCPAHVGGSCTCEAISYAYGSREADLERALEQACKDLQQAHNEVLRAQGCDEAKFLDYSWPSWTPQANTIRWAEKLLGKPLGKRAVEMVSNPNPYLRSEIEDALTCLRNGADAHHVAYHLEGALAALDADG